MPTATHAAARKQLDLLVRTGLGIEPIAPALASVVRQLLGAEGCFIGWFDERGVPAGFFHDSAPVATQELFLNNYQELFVGPHELTLFWLVSNKGRAVGNMLNVDKAFFKSNTYNLLFKPCDHHFGLDLRVDLNGVTRMVIGLFRTKDQPFSEADARRLHGLTPALQLAVVKTGGAEVKSEGEGRAARPAHGADDTGHLLVSAEGDRINMINESAIRLLRLARLFDQGVGLIGQMTTPPNFITQLCLALKAGATATVRSNVDVVGGILAISASWIKPTFHAIAHSAMSQPTASGDDNILVTVEFTKPAALDVVRNITQLDLSPLQSRIAMFAAAGGSRINCAAHHNVSKEALKKHLREIYAASRSADWQELTVKLNAS